MKKPHTASGLYDPGQMGRRFFQLLCIVLISSSVIVSCGSDPAGTNGENGNGNGNTGDPTEPTFSNVLDIFQQSCGGTNCHIGQSESGVRLDSYDNVINSEGLQYGGRVVIPGDAENSPLVNKISSNNPEWGDRMPLDGSPLSSDRIDLIVQWINNGAQNDDGDDGDDGGY